MNKLLIIGIAFAIIIVGVAYAELTASSVPKTDLTLSSSIGSNANLTALDLNKYLVNITIGDSYCISNNCVFKIYKNNEEIAYGQVKYYSDKQFITARDKRVTEILLSYAKEQKLNESKGKISEIIIGGGGSVVISK